MNRFIVSKLIFSLLMGSVAFSSHNKKGTEEKHFTLREVINVVNTLSRAIRPNSSIPRNRTVSPQTSVNSQIFRNHVNSKLMTQGEMINNHDEAIKGQQVDFDLLKDEIHEFQKEVWYALSVLENSQKKRYKIKCKCIKHRKKSKEVRLHLRQLISQSSCQRTKPYTPSYVNNKLRSLTAKLYKHKLSRQNDK